MQIYSCYIFFSHSKNHVQRKTMHGELEPIFSIITNNLKFRVYCEIFCNFDSLLLIICETSFVQYFIFEN